MALDTQNKDAQDAYESLLLGYAAGLLDQAQSLIVATHLALSPQARNKVRSCEAVGGALMEKTCSPVAMKRDSLARVLDKLDDMQDRQPREEYETFQIVFPEGLSIPVVLRRNISCRPVHVHWRTLYPGMQACDVSLECRSSHARFLKARRGVRAPEHTHKGMEITLVLDGAFSDDRGTFHRGELVVVDESCRHAPVACPQQGGTYMIVSSAPAQLTGLARLLSPFFRF